MLGKGNAQITANVTTGRRTIPALACTDNQLREIVARMQQSVEVIGNPSPAGAQNPPIAMLPYPWTIGIDFELTTPFDEDGHAEAREVDTDGTLPSADPEPDPPAPGGSPVRPVTHEVCTWPGAHSAAMIGDRGHAIRRLLSDGTYCWWVIFIIEGDPLGGPDGEFDFEDNLTDDTGGTDGEGIPDYTPHTPPNTGKAICFVASTTDHWVDFGAGRHPLLATGWSWFGWVKVPYASGSTTLIHKYKNGNVVDEWYLFADTSNHYFTFLAEFYNSGGSAVASVAVDSANDSWQDDEWHAIALKTATVGGYVTCYISVDGGAFVQGSQQVLSITPTAQTTGYMLANTIEAPPTLGLSTGDATYCLDHFRFWADRELSDDDAMMLYNGGVID